MAAHDHLSDAQFKTKKWYHGTDAELEVGSVLVPGSQIGKDNFGLGDNTDVHPVDSPELAGYHGNYVYEAEPLGPVRQPGLKENIRTAHAVVKGKLF